MRIPKILSIPDLKLEAQPDTLKELLNPDAFKLPSRKVEEKESLHSTALPDGFLIPTAAYTDIYGKDKPVWHYKKEESKQETKTPAANPELYKQQLILLADSIKQWGAQINPITNQPHIGAELLANIDTFKDNFFQPEYSGKQTADFFIITKCNLEKIWFVLTQSQSIPENEKIKELKILCEKIAACNSGVFTHLSDMAISLTKDSSLEYILGIMRKDITDAYAKAFQNLNWERIYPGNEVHISTALYTYSQDIGWAPLINSKRIHEQYGQDFTLVDDDVLVNFHKYFELHYTPRAILDCINIHAISEINKLKNLLAVKENKEGWMPYNQEFYDKTVELTNNLGCEWDELFESTEDAMQFKFDSNSFKTKFLKICTEKEKLFNPKQWHKKKLTDGFIIHRYANQLSWIETPDKQPFILKNKDEANAMLMRLVLLTPDETLALRDINKSLISHITNAFELIKLLSLAPDNGSAWSLMDIGPLGVDLIKEIIQKDPNFYKELNKLNFDLKYQITTRFYREIVLNAVSAGNADLLQQILTEAKGHPLVKNENGISILELAINMKHKNIIRVLADWKATLSSFIDENGNTPLHLAIESIDYFRLQKLTEHSFDLAKDSTQKNYMGETPIDLAIKKDNWAMVSVLLGLRQFCNKTEILLNAIGEGNLTAIKFIIPYVNLRFEYLPNHPFYKAIQSKYWLAVIDTLLECKVDAKQACMSIGTAEMRMPGRSTQINEKKITIAEYAITNRNLKLIKILAKHHVDFSSKGSIFKTSDLLYAIQTEQWEAVSLILKAKPSAELEKPITAEEENMFFPYFLVQRGDTETIAILVKQKVDFDSRKSWDTPTPLEYAIKNQLWDIISTILKLDPLSAEEKKLPMMYVPVLRGDINSCDTLIMYSAEDKEGNTIYHLAAKMNKIEILETLHNIRPDDTLKIISRPNQLGQTPLSFALEQKEWTMTEKLLHLEPEGQNPIYAISRLKNFSTFENNLNTDRLKILANHKVDFNIANMNGDYPIHLAIKNFNPKTLATLLDLKAQIDPPRKDGKSTSDFALECECRDTPENSDYESIRVLATHGLDFSKEDKDKSSPLSRTLEHPLNPKLTCAMLGIKGTIVNKYFSLIGKENEFSFLAKVAGKSNNTKLIHLIEKHNSDLSPAIYIAAKHGSADVMKALINYNAPDNIFKDSMSIAIEKKHPQIVSILAEKGINFIKAFEEPSLAVKVLTSLKEQKNLHSNSLKEANKHRDKLTAEFIKQVKSCKKPAQQKEMIQALLNKENILGIILNTLISLSRFKYTRKKYQDKPVTGSIYKIIEEFKSILEDKTPQTEMKNKR